MSDERRLVAGRYRLTERIGRGGMGTVWRAEDEVLARQVALKQLHAQPHLSGGEPATLYERSRREARSTARVVHPNVVLVHDVVDDDGRPCIVMEYVPAPTLADLLKGGGAVLPKEAARIGLGMIAALRAAHAAGVLHRDVKPGNVLLGAVGRVVLTDFGIALTAGTSTLTQTGEMVGSIDYMAPERVRGRTPGPASDLWALGATLYQAVEGRPPFRRPPRWRRRTPSPSTHWSRCGRRPRWRRWSRPCWPGSRRTARRRKRRSGRCEPCGRRGRRCRPLSHRTSRRTGDRTSCRTEQEWRRLLRGCTSGADAEATAGGPPSCPRWPPRSRPGRFPRQGTTARPPPPPGRTPPVPPPPPSPTATTWSAISGSVSPSPSRTAGRRAGGPATS
ncbi:Protein kinase domain-containing protein [Streptomyces sp. Ag109_G2-15]|nr:Protein kinase domain-containing protein [Streptomyces sp. Ag109_G2-15]